MNSNRKPPDEDETDRLLASRFSDTTPEFEARWVDLKREIRLHKNAKWRWAAWPTAWIGVATAGLVAFAVFVSIHRVQQAEPPHFSPEFVKLYEMNDVLGRALPLIDPENRDALLHLPAKSQSQTRGSS